MELSVTCLSIGVMVTYVTSTPWSEALNEEMSGAPESALLLRVDDGDTREFGFDVQENAGQVALVSLADRQLVQMLQAALSRVAIAYRLRGRVFEEAQFDTKGVSEAAVRLLRKCG